MNPWLSAGRLSRLLLIHGVVPWMPWAYFWQRRLAAAVFRIAPDFGYWCAYRLAGCLYVADYRIAGDAADVRCRATCWIIRFCAAVVASHFALPDWRSAAGLPCADLIGR